MLLSKHAFSLALRLIENVKHQTYYGDNVEFTHGAAELSLYNMTVARNRESHFVIDR